MLEGAVGAENFRNGVRVSIMWMSFWGQRVGLPGISEWGRPGRKIGRSG